MPIDSKHYVVTFDDAIAGHELVISVSGGRSGVLSEFNLLSALARPYCGYFDTLEEKAAMLMEAIIQNHGFVDGNKRTAVFLVYFLISLSDFQIVSKDVNEDIDLQMEDMAVALAEGEIEAYTITEWLKPRLKPLFPLHSPATPL